MVGFIKDFYVPFLRMVLMFVLSAECLEIVDVEYLPGTSFLCWVISDPEQDYGFLAVDLE